MWNLKFLWYRYAISDSAAMTADELKIFLAQQQFLAIDSQQANALIAQHEISTAKQEGLLTIAGTALSWNVIFWSIFDKI